MTVECRWDTIDVGDKAMHVYLCTPTETGPHPAIVVLQEIFGVNSHIRSVAERWAKEGYVVAAPDVFHRSGDRFESPYTSMQAGIERAHKLREDEFLRDMGSLLAALRKNPAVRKDRIGVTGFCMGGRLAFLTAATQDVQAAVTFYGGRMAALMDRASGLRGPLLAFFGEKDPVIPKSDVETIAKALTAEGKPHTIITYPDAGHGFFCDQRDSYHKPSAEDAWQKATAFFAEHLKR